VAWVDGHSKFSSDDYLASGTNYGVSNYASGGTTINGVTNNAAPGQAPTNYLWTLNGSLDDLAL